MWPRDWSSDVCSSDLCHHGAEGIYSLVARYRFHRSGLPDDRERRAWQVLHDILNHAASAKTADFFIIGDSEMDRPAQRPPDKLTGEREGCCDEGFHVGRAAPVKPAIARRQNKRIAAPALPLDRDDIAVPGQDDTARSL